MKIYIAGHNQEEGCRIASDLIKIGHTITSTWLDVDLDIENTSDLTSKINIAQKDIEEVLESDVLVTFSSPYRVPGGKFVEIGVALGNKIPIYLLGHRENMLMNHPFIYQFNSLNDLIGSGLVD